jgi:hypothetical protein
VVLATNHERDRAPEYRDNNKGSIAAMISKQYNEIDRHEVDIDRNSEASFTECSGGARVRGFPSDVAER